ncbi:MAG: TonB-dependent receptor [Bacteroidales bacterium]
MKKRLSFFIVFITLILINISTYGQADSTDVRKLFEMPLSELFSQEIITSSKYTQTLPEAASSISVIQYDEIKDFNFSTLAEVLNTRSGFYLSNDRNYIYAGSRGFSRPTDYNNRIVVLVNGHVINEVVYGASFIEHILGINPDDIEKIEIIKGPGTSIYGTGAMLNTINIIPKDGASGKGLRATIEKGSFGLHAASVSFGTKTRTGNVFIAAAGGQSKGENFYFPELDSPETNYGISERLDGENYGNFLTVFKTGNLTLTGNISSRKKGIPTGAFGTDLTNTPYSFDRRYFIESSYRKEFENNKHILLRGYYDNYFYKGFYPSDGENSYDHSSGKWLGTELQYFMKIGKKHEIISGTEFKHIYRADYKEWTDNEIFFDKNFPYSIFSVYFQDQFEIISNLKLTAGFRYDWYSVFHDAITPRIALVYNYSEKSVIKVLYNEGFRIPNIYEAHYESEGFHKHNPDIKPEKINAGEIAWINQISKSLTGSVSVYTYDIINLIDQYLDETDGLTSFKNIGKTRGSGIETEINFRHNNSLGGYVNLTYQRTFDRIDKNVLTNSPGFMLKSGLTTMLCKFFTVSPEFYYESGRKTLSENTTGNLFLINFSVNTDNIFKFLDFSFKVNNLLNRKYYSPAGFEHAQDMIIQPRRNALIKLSVKF